MAKRPASTPIVDEDDGDQTGLTEAPAEVSPEIQAQLDELARLKAVMAAQAADAASSIRVQKAGDFNPTPRPKAPVPAAIKRIRIVLEESVEIPPTGLFIQANGRPYLLLPSMEADVPPEVVNVLNDAVTSTPVMDTMTQQVKGFRNKLRFPYRVIDPNFVNPRAA